MDGDIVQKTIVFRIKANLPTYTHRDPSGVTGIHIVPLVKRWEPLSFFVLGNLKSIVILVQEYPNPYRFSYWWASRYLPRCPKNLKTPIVSRTGEPQGTGIHIALLSPKYQNPYRFSYKRPPSTGIWNALLSQKYWTPISFFMLGSLKVLKFKLPGCQPYIKTPIVSRVGGPPRTGI